MEDISFVILVAGFVILLCGILWAWTSKTTTVIVTESKKDIAKIGFEVKKLETIAKQNISLARNEIDSKKHLLDYEINSKNVDLEIRKQDRQLEEQSVLQTAKTSRKQLECHNRLDLAQLDIGFRNRKLTSQMEMFGKDLEFQNRRQEDFVGLRRQEIGFQLTELESRTTTTRYLADREFDSKALAQQHEDNRFKTHIETSLEIHRKNAKLVKESILTNREIGTLQIQSQERQFNANLDFKTKREYERTRRSAIKSAGFNNTLNNVIKGVAGIATAKYLPITGLSGILDQPPTESPLGDNNLSPD